jgi:hypothetical protein
MLRVTDERREGYQRTSFRPTPTARLRIDADHDGCDTRREVLIDEAAAPPEVGARCKLTGGSWHSYYDNEPVGEAGDLDIDHLI